MIHEGGQIKVPENVFGSRLDGFGNLSRLGEIDVQFSHLGGQEVVVRLVRYWPVEAREDLGGIGGHEAREVPREYIHAVVIDKLATG